MNISLSKLAKQQLNSVNNAKFAYPNYSDFATGNAGFQNPIAIQAIEEAVSNINPGKLGTINGNFLELLVEYLRAQISQDVSFDNLVFSESTFSIFEETLRYLQSIERETGKKTIFLSPEGMYSLYNLCAGKILDPESIISVSTNPNKGYAVQTSDIEKLYKKKDLTSTNPLLMIESPSSLGYVYTAQEIDKLVEISKQYGIYLFIDGVYQNTVYENVEFSPFPIEENIIHSQAMSKGYGNIQFNITPASVPKEMKEYLSTALGRIWRITTDIHVAVISELIEKREQMNKISSEWNKEYQERSMAISNFIGLHAPFLPQAGYSLPIQKETESGVFKTLTEKGFIIDPLLNTHNPNAGRLVYGTKTLEECKRISQAITSL